MPLNPDLQLEFAGVYQQRQFDALYAGNTSTMSQYFFEVPVMVRLGSSGVVSVAAGAYYARAIGNVKLTVKNGDISTSSTKSQADVGLKKIDFGLASSLRIRFNIESIPSMLDVGYSLGIKNVADTKTNGAFSYDDLHVRLGIALDIK